MKFGVLGHLQVLDDHDNQVKLSSTNLRRLLAAFIIKSGSVASVSWLCDTLDTTSGSLRTAVSRLRAQLGPDMLETRPSGYLLHPAEVDADEFEKSLARARLVATPAERHTALQQALGYWRGDPYEEFADEEWTRVEALRLSELRTGAIEDRIKTDIALGNQSVAIADASTLIAEHPYRDKPRELLLEALAAAGRRTDALRHYQTYRELLIEDIGTEPSPDLVDLERRIATNTTVAASKQTRAGDASERTEHDRSLRAAPVTSGTASLLLTQLVDAGSHWQNDPHAMAVATARYDAHVEDAVHTHSGVRPPDQGSDGETAVAAFVRPSDALAAAATLQRSMQNEPWTTRTAVELRAAVHTGEVHPGGRYGYAGITPILAARLRDLAQPGQVLVSSVTRDLVVHGDAPDTELKDLGDHRLTGIQHRQRVYQLGHPDMRADFAPLRDTETTPNNVPLLIEPLIGRVNESSDIVQLVNDHRLVSIIGSGGSGKTSLAQAFGRQATASFPDGIWWMELAARTSSEIPMALAELLNIRVDAADAATDLVVRRLGNDQTLLILDNCEHLLDGVSAIIDRLLASCPNVKVLATSRSTLDVAGETSWRIPAMSMPPSQALDHENDAQTASYDAIQLFIARARRQQPDFDPSPTELTEIVAICRWLDGLPLAIELAAARISVLTVHDVLTGLDDALSLLSKGARTAPTRHQTLAACIAWSADLLEEHDRTLLHELCVFSGGFDLDSAAAICSPAAATTPSFMLDGVENLIRLSLVSVASAVAPRRFTQLETVRQYGRRHLSEAAFVAASDRHARHYSLLAAIEGPRTETVDERSAVDRLEQDENNLRAALNWFHDQSEAQVLAALVNNLAPYWSLNGAMAESHMWLNIALGGLEGQTSSIRARLSAHRSGVRSNIGDFAGSGTDARLAIVMGNEVGDAWAVGRGRWITAENAVYGDLDRWLTLSDRALQALKTSGDEFALAYAQVWRAAPYLIRGHIRKGKAQFAEWDEAIAQVANPNIIGSHRSWRAFAALYAGQLDEAEIAAAELLAGAGFRLANQRSFAEFVAGTSASHRGAHHPMHDHFADRITWAQRNGEGLSEALYRQWQAQALLFTDTAAALELTDELRVTEIPHSLARCSANLNAAWASLASGDVVGAESRIEAAEESDYVMQWPMQQVQRLLIRALIEVPRDTNAAVTLAKDALDLARKEALAIDLVRAHEVTAVAAATIPDYEQTIRSLGVASELRRRLGMTGKFLPVRHWIVDAAQQAGVNIDDAAFGLEHAASAAQELAALK